MSYELENRDLRPKIADAGEMQKAAPSKSDALPGGASMIASRAPGSIPSCLVSCGEL
jgi:hypothetical protein